MSIFSVLGASRSGRGPLAAALILAVPLALSSAARAADAATAAAPSATAAGQGFNPAVSLILSGGYSQLQRDPASWRLPGFLTGGDVGPGSRGFSLGESELALTANIDPAFYGALYLAASDAGVSVEEAYAQTTALPDGFTLKMGRFLSGLGYLNEQHAHAWTFVDAPLAYQAFLGGQRREDGLQLRWLAPTDLFLELGAEVGSGRTYPGADTARNGAGAWSLFGHTGGDVGANHSWRAGLSLLQAQPRGRASTGVDASGTTVTDAFSGRSRTWGVDAVWKWAPDGNGARRQLTLQGEWLRRSERGTLTHDVDGTAGSANTDAYRSTQSGGYLQAAWRWHPAWQVGLRQDWLRVGHTDAGSNTAALEATRGNPSRSSLLLDWSPSHFSRVRLQLAQDRSRTAALSGTDAGRSDRQLMLQYQMSLGAHGAHGY